MKSIRVEFWKIFILNHNKNHIVYYSKMFTQFESKLDIFYNFFYKVIYIEQESSHLHFLFCRLSNASF